MALASIYGLASTNAIPKKKEGRVVYYSKKHFDIAKGVTRPELDKLLGAPKIE